MSQKKKRKLVLHTTYSIKRHNFSKTGTAISKESADRNQKKKKTKIAVTEFKSPVDLVKGQN